LEGGFTNYTSTDEYHEETARELERYHKAGYSFQGSQEEAVKLLATARDISEQQAQAEFDSGAVSKLAIIVKQKNDGTFKYRIVVDLRRSEPRPVNARATVPERPLLPRPFDVTEDVKELAALHPSPQPVEESMEFAAADLADAYMHFNVRKEELAECVSFFGNAVIVWLALCFGLTGAPLLWCRFAAALARLLVAAADPRLFRLELYLDDPLWTLWGTVAQRNRQLALAVWICLAVGTKFSWKKATRGTSLTWIGVKFTLIGATRHLLVSVPAAMIKDILGDIDKLLCPGRVPLRGLRRLTGRLSWASGILPRLRWTVNVLYAVFYSAAKDAYKRPPGTAGRPTLFIRGAGAGRRRSVTTPFLFDSNRVRLPLRWLQTLFKDFEKCPLVRKVSWDSSQPRLGFILDASPWGIGGVLFHPGTHKALEYFAEVLDEQDKESLGIAIGTAAAQQAAECLALVVAVKAWSRLLHAVSAAVAVRSDSTVAAALGNKLSSSAAVLNFLGAELALELEHADLRDLVPEHIPGTWNYTADALSRLSAPQPKPFPKSLEDIKRRRIPPRDARYFRLPLVGSNVQLWTGVAEASLFDGLARGLGS